MSGLLPGRAGAARRARAAAGIVAGALLALTAAGCGLPAWKLAPHDEYYQRLETLVLHPLPLPRELSEWWDMGWHGVARPVVELASPGHHLRVITGGDAALDVNAFGQVPDSPWFTNRSARHGVTREQMRRGPDLLDGPAPGPLLVISGKTEGPTPGLIVQDQRPVRWVVKFDPPAFPELASGAEVVATKVLHAAGYNVPENHVVEIDVDRFELAPGATTRGDYDQPVPLTKQRLGELIAQLNPTPAGRIRGLFSRFIPGVPLGTFSYRHTRADDPNDRIPHDRRRSLRGLRVFAALLDHTDVGSVNTYDSFITVDEQRGLGYVRHYLIDFGSTFGSGGTAPKSPYTGYSHLIDWRYILLRHASLGLHYPYWLGARKSPYRSIGMYEARVFEPERWRPTFPNPAFERATAEDIYWAGSILARIEPLHLRVAVSTARFSNPAAARYLAQVLIERREKLLQWAFRALLPLDHPRVARYRVQLEDLALTAGLLQPGQACYRWRLRWNRSGAADVELARGATRRPDVELAPAIARARAAHGARLRQDPFLTLSWWRTAGGETSPRLELHLRLACGRLVPVGLWRQVR